MAAELQSGRCHVEHADDQGVVDRREAEELFDECDGAFLVVDAVEQVADAVDNHEVDTTVLEEKLVHGLQDELHALIAGDAHEAVDAKPAGRPQQIGPVDDVRQVFVELVFRLLGIVEEDGLAFGIFSHVGTQGVDLYTSVFDGSGQDAAEVVGLAAAFGTGDAQEVALCAYGDIIDGDQRLRFLGWPVEVNFAGAHDGDAVLVDQLDHFDKKHAQIVGTVPEAEEIGDVLALFVARQGQNQAFEAEVGVLLAQPFHGLEAGFVHIVEQYEVLKPVGEAAKQLFGDDGGLAVHANGVETVRSEADNVLFAAGEEQYVAPHGQLLVPEDVIFGHFAGKQEADT